MWKKSICIVACFFVLGVQSFAAALPNVTILATGGTIAGAADASTNTTDYKPGSFSAQDLIDAVPAIADLAKVDAEQIVNVASGNISYANWLNIAKRINELLAKPDCDGVVVTHGTDTLEETAFFLNLVVKSTKPVVVVGSMRPATAISADGPLNLLNAVAVAASKKAVGKGVLIVLNGQIIAAREGTKTNTLSPETFKAPEMGMLGYVVNYQPIFYRESTRKHTKDTEFDVAHLSTLPRVDIVYQYIEVATEMYKAVLDSKPEGIVVAGTGNGSLSSDTAALLGKASNAGLPIVRSSRVASGVVTYESEYKDYNFILGDNLNPQKARILLALALTITKDKEKISEIFSKY